VGIAWIETRSTVVRFIDTNVLLYAVSNDPEEQRKADLARSLLAGRDLALSVQVLQEFYVQATRASRPDPLHPDQAALRFPIADVTPDIVRGAILIQRRFQLSYWDAAIIEAARSLGCTLVLSEDLSHEQDYAGVRVEDPFAPPA